MSLADATELASAAALANEIKEKYRAHRLTGNFHLALDGTNILATFPFASDYESAILLASHMKEVFGGHRSNNGGGYHSVTTAFPINESIPGLGIGEIQPIPAPKDIIANATIRVTIGEKIKFL